MTRTATAFLLLLASSLTTGTAQDTGAKVTMRSRFDTVGPWSGMLTSMGGGGANGCVAVVTHKGARLVRSYPNPDMGCAGGAWIVDFDEEKTYRVNPSAREYTEQSFGEVRRHIASVHTTGMAATPAMDMFLPTTGVNLPAQSRARAGRFEYTSVAKETGQRKMLFDREAREVVLTVTAVERGKTLDENGGWVVTNTLWLVPRMPAVDDLVGAMRRYSRTVTKGVYETAFTEIEFPGNEFFDPVAPEHGIVGTQVIAAMEKLDGTVLSMLSVYELARTAKEWNAAKDHYTAQQRRLTAVGARVLGGPPPQRERLITIQNDVVSFETNVTDADLAIPAGFRRK